MAKKKTDIQFFEAIGRRKEAVARVRLYIADKQKEVKVGDGTIAKGQIMVNAVDAEKFFPGNVMKKEYMHPLTLTDTAERFAISVHVAGGGKNGQIDAMVLGLARALKLADSVFHPILKKDGLLTRDSRIRQRRQVGMGGKSRRKKQSPKR